MELLHYSYLGFSLAFFLFLLNKTKPAVVVLFLSSLVVFTGAALFDPFLNLWDERFHALVAKNLMHHPLVPTLYDDPILEMEYFPWDRYHIWLHKQPLFLWQIALSYKLFGVSEFTLRIPNIIMAALLVVITYRSGKLLLDHHVGIYSATLVASSFYLMELVSGRQELEHNDLAFTFYVSASIWSWLEYLNAGKTKNFWMIVTAMFSGLAILNKWLPGLLIYLGWGIYLILDYIYNKKSALIKSFLQDRSIRDFFIALSITILIASPWQIYTWIQFPVEKTREMAIYHQHFSQALEGHGGDFWYHFKNIGLLFGKIVPWLIVPALVLVFIRIKDKSLAWVFIIIPVFVFIFYSIAKTKMPSFPFILIMIFAISLAFLIKFTEANLSKIITHKLLHNIILFAGLLLVVWFNMRLSILKEKHDPAGHLSQVQLNNKQTFNSFNNNLPAEAVIFNVKGRHYIECMFYTGMPSYNAIPTEEQIRDLKKNNRIIAVFNTKSLPDYLLMDDEIILIDQTLSGWD